MANAEAQANYVVSCLGVLYYLQNHRPGGVNHILGAGVATVSIGANGEPQATLVMNSSGIPTTNAAMGTWCTRFLFLLCPLLSIQTWHTHASTYRGLEYQPQLR